MRDDPVPTYVCSLCKVSVDAGNASLHFTSTAHRVSVLVSPLLQYCVCVHPVLQ